MSTFAEVLAEALVDCGTLVRHEDDWGIVADTLAEAVAAAGLAVIPSDLVNGVIKSFRDVEQHQLYDAATHRWIDLLAEAVK